MALSTTPALQSALAEHIHPEPQGFVRKYIFSIDHKIIGIQYLVTALIFFVIAGLLAELIRVQLFNDNARFLTPDQYNGVYTMHGTAMVWFVTIPLVTGGFGNVLIPLMIGARDVAFPWLNMVSYWIFPVAGALLFSAFLVGAPEAGWTEYPPVSLQGPPGTSLWALAVFLIGISSTMTGLNFLTTIIKMRAPGMTYTRMPLFVWAQLGTAVLNMIATADLSGTTFALFLERTLGIPFFDPAKGGSPLLWQHMFWFYSHPAVYIFIIPAFGIISEVLPVFARKPIYGYKMIAFSTIAITLISFMVWAHHMFTSGMAPWLQLPFMITTMIIAIPTGVKIWSWMGTLWGGVIDFTTAMLFATAFIITFTIGGLTGVMLAAVPADLHEHGTYFVVAHFHYVIFGGTFMGVFAGIYYWWPKVTGRLLNETVGKWQFWLTAIFMNVTFFPMHFLGLLGMPRRVAEYAPQFEDWNRVISIASAGIVVATLLMFINMFWSLRYGKIAGNNPWGARTLEWMIPSPPPYYNFKHIPAVLSGPYDFSAPLPYLGIDSETPTEAPKAPVPT
jgi:cytochrome c oxidase subunit I